MFFNRSLGNGGAERQLVTKARAMQARGMAVAVMVLYDGPMRAELDAAGVEVITLGKKGRWDFLFLVRLIRAVKEWRPDAIYCFGGAMLFGTLAKPFLKGTPLIWGIRASNMNFEFYGVASRLLLRLHAFQACRASLVICNSERGRQHVLGKGFPKNRTKVVPNGIDIERWQFDANGRERLRESWGATPEQILIGISARLDPIKDHATFLRMAAKCYQTRPNLRFVLIGGNTTAAYSKELHALAASLLPEDAVIWTGNCPEMEAAYSALDVLVLTSLAEGFPNAIGEGMACGLRVVSTDAGDARLIIGDTGHVTDIGDVDGLASAVLSLAADTEKPPHAEPRQRIVDNFSVDALLDRTLTMIGKAITGP